MTHPFRQTPRHRYLSFVLLTILSFLITFSFPKFSHQVMAVTGDAIIVTSDCSAPQAPNSESFEPSAAPPLLKENTNQQTAQTSSASTLLQTGIRQYESEQFAAAITSWTQALQNQKTTSDTLTQALLLSNLSLAHQHLGQWPQATETIAQSLRLLENPIDSDTYSETLAKALNTQGRLYWGQGNMEAALLSWREATTAYRQAGHKRGVLLSLINQAKALQTLGLHVQSKTILNEEISQILQNGELDPVLTAKGFWHLGNAQRQFGDLTTSQENLQQSLTIARTANQPKLASSVLLDLGNTERALRNSASAIGNKDDALKHQTAALAAYEEVANTGAASLNQVQANLNRLSFLIDLEEWSAAQALWPDLLSTINQLPASRTAIYAQLNFAKSLTTLMQVGEAQPKNLQISQAGTPSWPDIDAILVNAIQQAQALDDPIAESYGIGQRGELYEMLQQWPQAQALTQQALWLTNETQFLDGRYRWEWQQGRLLKKQGKQAEAVQAYGAAVKTLEQVRKNLLFIDAEVQFSFRDNVEPVYREFVELLLTNDEQASVNDQTLNLAIQQIDSLQLSELENFLRCDLASTTTISQFEADTDAAILYPIILPDRIAVILQLKGKKIFTNFEIPQETAEAKLEQLRRDLSNAPNRTPEVRTAAKEIYKWLFSEKIELALQDYDIKTLVFVLDGALRNIPMAVLNDGEQYLVEKYAIAIAPELELFTPRPLTQELRVFTGGVGTPQKIEDRQFPAIEKLDAELDKISELFGPQPPLTNENFQREALQQQLSTGGFSGIHIKTHGVFSSDPEETFIVAHQKLIRGQELGDLIQSASVQGETPIELLVLSACSTATGDNRAILGLAGIAVRAGARSTVSTLWEAQDTPNTALMIRFYEELKQPGTSRAKALQNAQLALIEQGYRAPHLWATYVLVGNWR